MPRPKSDLIQTTFRLSPADLSALDTIAKDFGLFTVTGSWQGTPDRSAAVRRCIRLMEEKLDKARVRKAAAKAKTKP